MRWIDPGGSGRKVNGQIDMSDIYDIENFEDRAKSRFQTGLQRKEDQRNSHRYSVSVR